MKYFVRGKSEVILNQNNFVSKGGEGSIFRKGNITYKIYEDAKKMIPEAKIKELQLITKQNVIKPKDIILNKKNTVVGFTMDWVNAIPLCKLFTNDFRNRSGITEDSTIELIENMKLTIDEIHKVGCLIVDANEFNFLADNQNYVIPYFIDVNSYKTPSFPATAIMPSIRDWHTKEFTELSDWFSFAIIACQLLVGIHPFKGRHPKYKKNDIESRMKSNVSIFNNKVRVPAPTRDFNIIPSKYKEWFIDLFENGKRLLPPELPGTVILTPVVVTVVKSTDKFEIKFLKEFDSEIYYHGMIFGNQIVKTKEKLYIGNVDYKISQGTEILFTPKYSTPILVKIDQEKLKLKSLDNNKKINAPELNCQDLMIIDNVLYIKNNGALVELTFNERQEYITLAIKNTWNIMQNSSIIFSGVVYQSVLGKPYLVIPLPKIDGLSSCIVKDIPEIEDYKIIEAKHDSGVCVLIAYKDGIYSRMIFKFNKNYTKYSFRLIEDITDPTINFTTLDNGVVVMMNDDLIEIFSNDIYKDKVSAFDDPDVDSTMKLCKNGTEVRFYQSNKLYTIKMKQR